MRYFPEGTRLTRPSGGFILWVQLPEDVNSLELYKLALQSGITLAPGHVFSATYQFPNFIRLNAASFNYATERALERGAAEARDPSRAEERPGLGRDEQQDRRHEKDQSMDVYLGILHLSFSPHVPERCRRRCLVVPASPCHCFFTGTRMPTVRFMGTRYFWATRRMSAALAPLARKWRKLVDAALGAMLAAFACEPLLTGLGAGGYMLVVAPDRPPTLLDFFVEAPGHGAEVAGIIVVLLALIGLGFSVDPIALLLIIVGVVLLILEAKHPGFGAFGVGGIIAIAISDTLFHMSLNIVGAGISAIIDCLYSPLTVLLATLLLGERLGALQLLGMVLVISGVLAAARHEPPHGVTAHLEDKAEAIKGDSVVLAFDPWSLAIAVVIYIAVSTAIVAALLLLARFLGSGGSLLLLHLAAFDAFNEQDQVRVFLGGQRASLALFGQDRLGRYRINDNIMR